MTLAPPPACCIACGGAPRPDLHLAGGVPLLRCPRCGLAWWNWPDFDASDFYGQSYFQSHGVAAGYNDYAALEPGQRRTARARLRRIARLRAAQAAPGRLLELGCGTGVFLDQAQRDGWSVEGVEISPYASAVARRRGLKVTVAAAEDACLPAAAFDCVCLWDTVEHLREPARVLASAARALRPGGVLALSTGDVTSLCARLSGPRWHLFNLPEHLYFFSPRSLRRLLGVVGCPVARLTREVNWVPLGYVVERVAKMSGHSHGGATGLLARLVLPATVFDVLGVYGLKRRTVTVAAA